MFSDKCYDGAGKRCYGVAEVNVLKRTNRRHDRQK